jgi:hypothetical protein
VALTRVRSAKVRSASLGSRESRRNSSLLAERTVSGTVMIVVLSIAFVSGLVGFAVRVSWVVTVVTLALGLGYVIANVRKDHVERLDRADDRQATETP